MSTQPTIDFPGDSRVHIALAVADLARARTFYETLLGVAPSKERPGYVKFEPRDPSLNLTLNEAAGAATYRNPVVHYGIQVKTRDAVQAAISRLSGAGLATSVERDTTCCYAVQDKVWVSDREGNQWEVFVVTDADAGAHQEEPSGCGAVNSSRAPGAGCC